MTKKLSLAALALISACYFTACDDDSSPSSASNDQPKSSASVESSDDSADPESSASDAKDEEPSSSASDAKDDESSSSIKIDAACDINYDSDKWSFDAKTEYMGQNVSVNGKIVFEGKTATNTMKMVWEMGDKTTCEMYKMLMSGDMSALLPEGVELPEGAVEEAEENVDIKAECDDKGTLSMTMAGVEENVTEESKKEAYDEMVEACQKIQSGDLSGFMGDDEE